MPQQMDATRANIAGIFHLILFHGYSNSSARKKACMLILPLHNTNITDTDSIKCSRQREYTGSLLFVPNILKQTYGDMFASRGRHAV
jgi:hypothetical protein